MAGPNYLHGVETIEIERGPVPVSIVKSAVIALVGVSPLGPRQQLVELLSAEDAAQFGVGSFSGGTIAPALAAINAQGAANVLVVNVFNPATHLSPVTGEDIVVEARKFQIGAYPTGAITVKDGATTVYTGTGYTVTALGEVTLPDTAVIANGDYTVDYSTLDLADVSASHIIGTIDNVTNARTGLKLLDLSFGLYGYKPKILIAPVFVETVTVAAELIAVATKLKAMALIDAPGGTTFAGAIQGRGPSGSINFNFSSDRAVLCYPRVKAVDDATGQIIDQPMSQFLAGVICATDLQFGYWWSPSSKNVQRVTGLETPLSHDPADSTGQTETNRLNEVGITTVGSFYGSGWKTFGNRSSAFPTVTAPRNFIPVRRTADIVHESLERAVVQFLDRPLNQALIDDIRNTGNEFLNVLAGRGAVFPGSEVIFDPAKNPPVELAAGKVRFDLVFMAPTPAERITFESFLDINLLRQLA